MSLLRGVAAAGPLVRPLLERARALSRYQDAIALVIAAILAVRLIRPWFADLFWDYQVYARAVAAFVAGGDPYLKGEQYLFIYPPAFLRVFSVVDFTSAYAAVVAGLVAMAIAGVVRDRGVTMFPLVGALIGGTGLLAVLTGNITIFMHVGLVGAACLIWAKPRSDLPRLLFVLLVVASAAVKPYVLAYLAVLVLLPRRSLGLAAAAIAAVGAVWAADWIADRALFAAFLDALAEQTVRRGDLGLTLAATLARHGAASFGAVLHVAVVVALVWYALRRRGVAPLAFRITGWSDLYAVLAVVIAINPRLKEYDFCVLAFCAYAAVGHAVGDASVVKAALRFAVPVATYLLLRRAPLGPETYPLAYSMLTYGLLAAATLLRQASAPRTEADASDAAQHPAQPRPA